MCLDLAGDRRHDAVPDAVEDVERLVQPVVEHLRPENARGLRLGEFDRRDDPLALTLQ